MLNQANTVEREKWYGIICCYCLISSGTCDLSNLSLKSIVRTKIDHEWKVR